MLALTALPEDVEFIAFAIEMGIEQSRLVILVLTPAALQSQWIALETSVALFSDPAALRRRVVPVVLEPIEEKSLRPAIRRLNRIDLSDRGNYISEYRRLVTALGKSDNYLPSGTSIFLPQTFDATELPHWPFPVLSLMGTKGGTGKTTIVVAMAELMASTGENILIIDADLEVSGATKYLSGNAKARPNVWTVLDAAYEKQGGITTQTHKDLGAWDVTPNYLRRAQFGNIYLIPSKHTSDTRNPYEAIADIHPDTQRNAAALSILVESIDRHRHLSGRIGAVLIDSGAENNPLVSAGIVLANYGYIVSGPHPDFASDIPGYERKHRTRYPDHEHRAMTVIVNQATDETKRGWFRYPNAQFVMEDKDYRESAAAGKVDFEGVGLNNLYLNVLKVLQNTVSSSHLGLLPDPSEVWVKPYLRKLGRFPEVMLRQPKYRWLNFLTFSCVTLSLGVIFVSIWFMLRAFLGPYNATVSEILPPADTSLSGLKQELAQIQIPEKLRGKLEILGASLVLKAPISTTEKASFIQEISYEPLVVAFNKASQDMEERQSFTIAITVLIGVLALAFGLFRIVRFFPIRKQKLLLEQLIKLRDSADEKNLSKWIQAILMDQSKDNELRWLRNEYQHWLGISITEEDFSQTHF